MKAKEYRKYFAREIRKDSDPLRDLNFIGCCYKKNDKIIKGFFELFHGYKEQEIGFLRSQVEIAEDSQAIYEFIQNAADAGASDFYIFWDEDNFLVINNGKKFDLEDISSILNFSQSTKSGNSIGKFGIEFKLIHRLVGDNSEKEDEANGLKAIIEEYKGPILFSWNNYYIKSLLNKDLREIDKHWLFKIIYTNFPAGLNEKVRDKNYRVKVLFNKTEFDEMINFIKKQKINFNNLLEGSLFYLKLGKRKNELLNKEMENIENNISFFLQINKAIKKNKKSYLKQIIINDLKISIENNFESISNLNLDYIFLFPSTQKSIINFYKNNKKVSFFKFFPLRKQKNSLNFVIHSSKFDIESNREKLHEENNFNKTLLQNISKDICKKLDDLKNTDFEKFLKIISNLYLSDLESANGDNFIKENFTKNLLNYILINIPTKNKTILKDKNKVVIINSKLKNIPLKNKYYFYFEDTDIVKEAKRKIKLKSWNIVKVLLNDNINEWVLKLDNDKFNVFLEELKQCKSTKSQKIVTIWKDNYLLDEVKKILKIFSVLDKDIKFAIVEIDDRYKIIPNASNYFIKNQKLKYYLEKNFKSFLEEKGIYFIYSSIEKELIKIFEKKEDDKYILSLLLKEGKHREIIKFIEKYNLEQKYLDTLERLDFDISKKYEKNSFELKTLDFMLKDGKNIENYKRKIFIDGKSSSEALISPFITFKYQGKDTKIINPLRYNNNEKDIANFIANMDKKYHKIFSIKEDDKDKVYEYIKKEIFSKWYLNKKINTKNRLKFILLYSLEKGENFIKEFNGIKIKEFNEEGNFRYLNKVLLKHIKIENDNQLKIFHISDFFPEKFKRESYFIKDEKYALKEELLPKEIKKEYISQFIKIGLNIDDNIPALRKKLLNNEKIKRDEIRKCETNKLLNTLKFISYQNKEYKIAKNSKNLKRIYSQLEIENLEYFPVLKTKTTFRIEKVDSIYKNYILFQTLKSDNKFFQKRLDSEIKSKNIILIDILNSEEIPSFWKKIEENEEEKRRVALVENKNEIKSLDAIIKENISKYNDRTAKIGRKGELLVKEKLIEKFGADRIIDNNKNGESGKIDFEILDENKERVIHYVEVKSTVKKTINDKEVLTFYMSANQYKHALNYKSNYHLVFVSGVMSDNPQFLWMTFDNNWLTN